MLPGSSEESQRNHQLPTIHRHADQAKSNKVSPTTLTERDVWKCWIRCSRMHKHQTMFDDRHKHTSVRNKSKHHPKMTGTSICLFAINQTIIRKWQARAYVCSYADESWAKDERNESNSCRILCGVPDQKLRMIYRIRMDTIWKEHPPQSWHPPDSQSSVSGIYSTNSPGCIWTMSWAMILVRFSLPSDHHNLLFVRFSRITVNYSKSLSCSMKTWFNI